MKSTDAGTKSTVTTDLKTKLAARVPEIRAHEKEIIDKFGDRQISEVTVRQAFGGMRGVKCMVTETSAVDPIEGIRFRGYSIPELQEKLPSATGGGQPLPEARPRAQLGKPPLEQPQASARAGAHLFEHDRPLAFDLGRLLVTTQQGAPTSDDFEIAKRQGFYDQVLESHDLVWDEAYLENRVPAADLVERRSIGIARLAAAINKAAFAISTISIGTTATRSRSGNCTRRISGVAFIFAARKAGRSSARTGPYLT